MKIRKALRSLRAGVQKFFARKPKIPTVNTDYNEEEVILGVGATFTVPEETGGK